MAVWTSPRTWLAGEDPPAATWNLHLRDQLKVIGDAWIAYTPVWTAVTTNPVIGNGSLTGAYRAVGKHITFRIIIVAGSTTTWGSGAYSFTYPPFPPLDSTTNGNPGTGGFFWDNSTTQPFAGTGVGQSTTTFRMVMASSNSYMSNAVPVAGAVSDKINIAGFYEAA